MKKLFLMFLILSLIVTCTKTPAPKPPESKKETPPGEEQTLAALCNCIGDFEPKLDPNDVPVDVAFKVGECGEVECQPCADCFAWQMFISLNWVAESAGKPDVAAPFGKPGDTRAVVWESYKNVDEIFTDGPPSVWGASPKDKNLGLTSAVIHLKENLQVDHNWLTDQNGQVVYYEIRVNEDEFNYIVNNTLYSQEGIYKAYADGAGITLPPGGKAPYLQGSIEIKAAWRIVPDGELAQFEKTYKISKATIGDAPEQVDVALVGLHIVKKTPSLDQLIWATFEHKDNAPTVGDVKAGVSYGFYNPDAPADYTPNYQDPPNKFADPPTPKDKPVQMARLQAIPKEANEITEATHVLIKAKQPDSVWLNYQLVNVQWPTKPVAADPKATKPQSDGSPTPPFLANITMESYLQEKNSGGFAGLNNNGNVQSGFPAQDAGKSSCIGCHRFSAITPEFAQDPDAAWYTDYSAIFFKAKSHKKSND